VKDAKYFLLTIEVVNKLIAQLQQVLIILFILQLKILILQLWITKTIGLLQIQHQDKDRKIAQMIQNKVLY